MGGSNRVKGILLACTLGLGTGVTAEDVWYESFRLIQTGFLDSACGPLDACEGPCNVLMVAWSEEVLHDAGFDIFVDGEIVAHVPGLDPEDVPGANGLFLYPLEAGTRVVKLEEAATGLVAEKRIVILDNPPFRDAQDVQGKEGGASGGGFCELVVGWTNGGVRIPDTYLVLINDIAQAEVPAWSRGLGFTDVPPGDYLVEVVGFLENESGTYRGCFVADACQVDCQPEGCVSPEGLFFVQTDFGPAAEQNVLEAHWINGQSDYQAVNITVDGELLGSVAGGSTYFLMRDLPPGEVSLGVQGDCGDAGVSAILERTITVLSETPHTRPVEGSPQTFDCAHDAIDATITATWNNGDPSLFVDVFVEKSVPEPAGERQLTYQFTISGNASTVEVADFHFSDDETLYLQFFRPVEGQVYGSELITCHHAPELGYFIRGICGGGDRAAPQITDAILLLQWLFLGGTKPPCLEACDANADVEINLTDAVYVLNFLFNGGAHPVGWADAETPTCESVVVVESDCEASNARCP